MIWCKGNRLLATPTSAFHQFTTSVHRVFGCEFTLFLHRFLSLCQRLRSNRSVNKRPNVHDTKRRRFLSSQCGPVGQDLLVPGLGGGADALLQLTAILQLLPSLLSLLQLYRRATRGGGGVNRRGRGVELERNLQKLRDKNLADSPLFLAWATISSYCSRCF